MRPQGSPAELEQRRLRAIDLLQRDIPVHVVAERLGVDRRSGRRSGGVSDIRPDPSMAGIWGKIDTGTEWQEN